MPEHDNGVGQSPRQRARPAPASSAEAPPRLLRVLAVDDSALMRQAVAGVLTQEGGFDVTTASDPFIAMEKMLKVRPDVMLLDLEMPRMDGLTFLRKIMMEEHPIPVVICSALTGKGTDLALRALEEGALEVVAKPQLGVREFLVESSVFLADALRAAARAHPRTRTPAAQGTSANSAPGPRRPIARQSAISVTTDKVIAIGASTGGTEALRAILQVMPPECPGIVIVQHMPAGFTRAFADGVDKTCTIDVREAADGDRIIEGRALIAPGNRHLEVVRSGAHYVVRVSDGPLVSRHRPSVDLLFRSLAAAAGANAVGVILTGMGNDGADGLLQMRVAGAATIAQNEESCVVFGMPREAIARGAVEEVVSLDRIPSAILRRVATRRVPSERKPI